MSLLTIAIPTFHNSQMLHWCMGSMKRDASFDYEIILVDNGSRDNEENYLSDEHGRPYDGRVRVLRPGRNLGWMGAINLALEHTRTPLFCMLNDDVVFLPGRPGFWNAMASWLDHDIVGAVGPCSNFAAGSQSLMAALDGGVHMNDHIQTSMLIGFCLMMRTKDLKSVGGLDADLPGGDDLDLSIRLRESGLALVVDRTLYLHHHGQSTGKRVYGEDWDSSASQEKINNALIKKHGVRKWYECYSCGWRPMSAKGPSLPDRFMVPLAIDDGAPEECYVDSGHEV